MLITSADSFVLRVPIGAEIADSMQSVANLEIVGLTITTDEAITGTGYTITVGYGGSVIKEVLDSLYIGELPGKDPHDVREIWHQLYYGKGHWIGRSGATTMAQAAVDIALWDIIAKAAQKPLWRILGGGRTSDIPVYNTNAGWLNFSIARLQDEALRLLDQGYSAVKMKVDVCRVGGITPWLDVAAMAHAHGIRVCPHCGDLMQVHQHLVKAIPNSWYLEVIPLWDVGPFRHQIRIAGGKCLTPTEPGASTDLTALAFEKYRVS